MNTIQRTSRSISGIPPMAKWEREPVSAVNVIMKTLVPTAVFSSKLRTLVKRRSIIMPPPAPIKPQIKPTTEPQITDFISFFFAEMLCMASFVVITGLTINLMPSRNVIITEKLPIVAEGTRLDI